MSHEWYAQSLCKLKQSMHVCAGDEYFRKADPEELVLNIAKSNADAAFADAVTIPGYATYPTKVGEMYPALEGTDFFGEVTRGFHKHGMRALGYYSLVYSNRLHDRYPHMRMLDCDGAYITGKTRWRAVCLNSQEYVELACAQLTEICGGYELDGLWFDMAFWPGVCYCQNCQMRHAEEVGGPIPNIVDWENKRWVAFQRKREEWLRDFCTLMMETCRKANPELTLIQQSGPLGQGASHGFTYSTADAADVAEGDKYGDYVEASFAAKLYYSVSNTKPFSFMTSVQQTPYERTIIKTADDIKMRTFMMFANGGGISVIDHLQPDGRPHGITHARVGEAYAACKPYETCVGGEPVTDAAIYFSTHSKFTHEDNGCRPNAGLWTIKEFQSLHNVSSLFKKAELPLRTTPHIAAVEAASRILTNGNILHAVITKKQLYELSKYKILLLPNVMMMDDEEVEAIRDYVKNGGLLYASKYTSLWSADGTRNLNFRLADVFGVDYCGDTKEVRAYIVPEDDTILPGYSSDFPLIMVEPVTVAKPAAGAEILGRLGLPHTVPQQPFDGAYLMNEPCGRVEKEYAALAMKRYGKGKAIYSAGTFELLTMLPEQFKAMLTRLNEGNFTLETNAHRCVEISLFHKPEERLYAVHFVNAQEQQPAVPMRNIEIKLRCAERIVSAEQAVTGKSVTMKSFDDGVEFTLPELEQYACIYLRY